MKFSLSILTAGILLATAAALPSSDLRKFSTLEESILSKTTECDAPDTSKGFVTSLTLTNCTQANYPCHCEQGGTYTLTAEFMCGQIHGSLRGVLTATAAGMTNTVFNQAPDNAVQCILVGQPVSASFTFTVKQTTIPTTYDVVFKVFDGGAAAPGDNEVCRKGQVVVDVSLVIGAVSV